MFDGAFLADLRLRKGWSQQTLADKLDISVRQVSRWETSESEPGAENVRQIARIFRVQINDFYDKK